MYTFLTDVRYGGRVLLRSPGFSFVAVAALAIGIGANLTIFGFAKELLLSPPAGIADPDRVVRVFTNRFSNTAFANFEAYRDRNHTFVALAAFRAESMSLRGEERPGADLRPRRERQLLQRVRRTDSDWAADSAGGRSRDAPGVVVISDRFWRLRWAANPGVLGQSITLNGRPAAIIGVPPLRSRGRWRPSCRTCSCPSPSSASGGDISSVQLIGRLRPGVAIGEAQADLMTLAAAMVIAPAADRRRPMITVYPGGNACPGDCDARRSFLGVLLAVVGLVLLLACVNIANLLLSRSAARTREIGIRTAVGASRSRLVRQLLTESLLLACRRRRSGEPPRHCGCAADCGRRGLAPFACPDRTGFRRRLAAHRRRHQAVARSRPWRLGLMPALQSSRHDVLPALKDGAATAAPKQSRLRALFLTTQVAMSTLLLVLAALFVRGLVSAQTLDRGLVTDGVLAASIDLESAGYNQARGAILYEQLLERLEQTPGLTAANIVDIVPLTLSNRAVEW